MLRLFVGIEFPPELKLQLSLLETGMRGAKWVDAGNLHLTLRFIGDVDDAMAALEIVGLPAIIRPSFTLGGTGGGIAYNREEFIAIVEGGLEASPGPQDSHYLFERFIDAMAERK